MRLKVIQTQKYSKTGLKLRESNQRIVVFSDSHMGDTSSADDFDRLAFLWFLENVVREGDLVVGAGDILDIWESSYRMFRKHAVPLSELMANDQFEFIYVFGNHDYQMSRFAPVFTMDQFVFDGILIEHGNKADIFNNGLSFIGKAATVVNSFFERVFKRGLDEVDKKANAMNKLQTPSQLNDAQFMTVKQQYIDYIKKQIDSNDQVFAGVFGHTHRLESAFLGKTNFHGQQVPRLVVNSGNFVGDNTFVIFDKSQFCLCKVVK